MSIFNEFPYTNFHDLNLDWIISKVRELDESWQTVSNEWSDFREYVNNYLANLDIDAGLREIIDEMISTGEFMDLVRTADAETINAWLAANITNPSNPPLDRTFLLSGAAANSQQVGYFVDDNQNMINVVDHITTETNITVTENHDAGTVSIVGNATTDTSFYLHDEVGDPVGIPVRAGVNYMLTGCPAGGGPNLFDLDLRTSAGGVINYADYGDGIVFTPESDTTLYPHIRINTGNGNGLTFRPMLIEGTNYIEFIAQHKRSAVDRIAREFIDNADVNINTELSDGYTVDAMLKVCETYIDHNSDLTYGQRTAVHWYENGIDQTAQKIYVDNELPTEIDCSTLALLVLMGVPYDMSRYAGNKTNYIGFSGFSYDIYNGDVAARNAHTGERTLTYNLAKWLSDNGIGFEVNAQNIGNLRAGDLLFFRGDGHDTDAYLDIDHCEILLDKAFNYNTNQDYPTLVTLNCSDGRTSPVQVSMRYAGFYNGTNTTHRRLVYAAHLPLNLVRTVNKTTHLDIKTARTRYIAYSQDNDKAIKITFDGTINVANRHFTIIINGNPYTTTPNITTELIGKKLHYELTVGLTSDMTTLLIDCTDTTGIVENVMLSKGVNR